MATGVNRVSLLNQLANDYGFDGVSDMLEACMFDSVCPAICTVCGYTTDMEPDQNRGWCEECGKNTVKSALILAGVI